VENIWKIDYYLLVEYAYGRKIIIGKVGLATNPDYSQGSGHGREQQPT
jgi:hypothetical protein